MEQNGLHTFITKDKSSLMESKIITDISVFNALGMNEFEIISFNKDDDSLVIRAHSGSPHLFWAELIFHWTGYIACPTCFFDVHLRLARPEEILQIGPHKNSSQLFCFEDLLEASTETPDRFFVAANSVQITVYYGGEHLDTMLGRVSPKQGYINA
jgi:hypothetical protein